MTELAALRDELLRCNRCGLCQAACPVYRATGRERDTARGHVAHLNCVFDGRLRLDDVKEALSGCLLCGACVSSCMPSVPIDRLVRQARAVYSGSPASRALFRHLLPRLSHLTPYLKLLFLVKRFGLSGLANGSGLLRLMDVRLAHAEGLLERPPRRFLTERLARHRRTPEDDRPYVLYFIGCGYSFALPDAGEASFRVLQATGRSIRIQENVCCGLPAYTHGDVEAARSLARRNLRLLEDPKIEAVVTDCGSCYSFLRSYPELFEGDPDLQEGATRFAGKVREFSEFMLSTDLPSLRPLSGRITYHDPCHLSRHERVTEEPRELLRRIPGVEFVELPEADWCCGGAGSYGVEHPETSKRILDRKMEALQRTGAEILVTSCPACMIQLGYGVRSRGMPVEVLHVSQVVERSCWEARRV